PARSPHAAYALATRFRRSAGGPFLFGRPSPYKIGRHRKFKVAHYPHAGRLFSFRMIGDTRYSVGMQIREGRPPRSGQLKRVGVELGRAAKVRLMWMDYYRATENVALTCRHFGISRQTFYRWQRRYDPLDLTTRSEETTS